MTRYLGGLGARIIKIEWPKGPDPMRTAMFHKDTKEMTYNNGAFFSNLNVGKESVTINVKSDEGLEVIKDLIREVDVVTESFSSSVMKSWGLSFKVMKELNPSIVYASISGFGHNGPHAPKNTWGPTAQAMSGMTAISGVPGRDPAGWGYSYLDVTAGYMGAIGVLGALKRAQSTGEGTRLDLSQVETGLSLIGPALTEYLTTGAAPPETFPEGNRSVDPYGRDVGYRGDRAPLSNVFRTKGQGDNDWVALTVETPEQWEGLLKALTPALDEYAELAFSALHEQVEAIESSLSEYFLEYEKYEATELLATAGVPAAPVQAGMDRVENDPQLAERGLLQNTEHPALGDFRVQALPVLAADGQDEWQLKSQFPLLGADTSTVLREVLGYSQEKIDHLESHGILWPEGVPREMKIERSLW